MHEHVDRVLVGFLQSQEGDGRVKSKHTKSVSRKRNGKKWLCIDRRKRRKLVLPTAKLSKLWISINETKRWKLEENKTSANRALLLLLSFRGTLFWISSGRTYFFEDRQGGSRKLTFAACEKRSVAIVVGKQTKQRIGLLLDGSESRFFVEPKRGEEVLQRRVVLCIGITKAQ